MADTFDRCIYCFAPKAEPGACPACSYEDGLCEQPGWWLTPGTVLKGRYMVGKNLSGTAQELRYLGWDLGTDELVEIVEYYPEDILTRDITHSTCVSCLPGRETELESGKQAFFEKARLFCNCVSRVESLVMDFFVRNGTCYYVRRREKEQRTQESK